MRRHCRRDLKKIKIQIHKPHIPKGKGDPYIFIKRSFMREDVIMKHKEETRFYLETGNIKVYIGGDFTTSYTPEEVVKKELISQELDKLMKLIKDYFAANPKGVKSYLM